VSQANEKNSEQVLKRPSPWRRPLSTLFRVLGFEWRFYFTFPIPYHPVIAWALPFVPIALVGWALIRLIGGERPGLDWWTFALTGLLLIVPLSVPVFNWIAFAFRVPLLQGFCFLSSMVLLAAEVAAGREAPWLAALPIAYFSIFLVQRIGGPRLIARMQADNANFVPLNPGRRLVRFRGPGSQASRTYQAQRLFEQAGLAMVAIAPRWSRAGTLLFRPDEAAERLLRSALKEGEYKATKDGLRFENIRIPRIGGEIRMRLKQGKSWLLAGRITVVTVKDGAERRRLSAGKAAPIGNWPLLVLAYDFAIFSGGARNGAWHGGFAPGKPVELGERQGHGLIDQVFVPQTPSAQADAEAMQAVIDAVMPKVMKARARSEAAHDRQIAIAEAEVKSWLAHDGHSKLSFRWRFLRDRPDLLAGQGKRLCVKLAEAKEARDRQTAEGAAALLASIPLEEFVAIEDELIPLLGSRILALEWQLTPELDVSKLPKKCPRWGPIAGFGLMGKVPELWARLGELGPRAERIVAIFMEEVGERPPLVEARERFRERFS
jgi:hypothetical protein